MREKGKTVQCRVVTDSEKVTFKLRPGRQEKASLTKNQQKTSAFLKGHRQGLEVRKQREDWMRGAWHEMRVERKVGSDHTGLGELREGI